MPVLKRVGPLSLTITPTTNIYNPPTAEILRNLHIINHTDTLTTFSLWLGLSGQNTVGTELFSRVAVGPRSYIDWPFPIKIGTADFLVGSAEVSLNALTITITSEPAVA